MTEVINSLSPPVINFFEILTILFFLLIIQFQNAPVFLKSCGSYILFYIYCHIKMSILLSQDVIDYLHGTSRGHLIIIEAFK